MSGFMQVLGGFLAVVVLVVWVITIYDIVRSRLGAGKTAAWLLIVIILPLVGSALYWILRKPQADEIQRQFDNERALRESAAHRPVDSGYIGP
jgi:ABC-type nickel/cobalt efflux system permease component RcnA